jgi:hypothetical protein
MNAAPKENRKYPRKPTNLAGRYMLANRREYACTIVEVSLSGAVLVAPVVGRLGERVVVYAEELGRMQGEIARLPAASRSLDREIALKFTPPAAAAPAFARRLKQLPPRTPGKILA